RLSPLFQRQGIVCAQEGFDRASKPGPKFDLPGDRALGHFASESSVEDEAFGKFDRLSHSLTVAFCYLMASLGCQSSQRQLPRAIPMPLDLHTVEAGESEEEIAHGGRVDLVEAAGLHGAAGPAGQ